jgi:SnoaL-like domain
MVFLLPGILRICRARDLYDLAARRKNVQAGLRPAPYHRNVDQYSPERIADRLAIQDVMYKWCRAIDRLDYDGMRSVFHSDAVDHHGPYEGGAEGLVEWLRDRHRAIPFSSHQISNILIEFATPDRALVETYARTLQRYPPEAREALAQFGAQAKPGTGVDLMTSSRYVDVFERRGGEWRIAHRQLIHDWKQLLEVSAAAPQPKPGWVTGRRDGEDYVQVLRRELGLGR